MVRLKSIYVHSSNSNTLAPLKSRFKPNPKLLVPTFSWRKSVKLRICTSYVNRDMSNTKGLTSRNSERPSVRPNTRWRVEYVGKTWYCWQAGPLPFSLFHVNQHSLQLPPCSPIFRQGMTHKATDDRQWLLHVGRNWTTRLKRWLQTMELEHHELENWRLYLNVYCCMGSCGEGLAKTKC